MCDTIGRVVSRSYAIFGKNSDRAVNEPQVVEYYPAKDYEAGTKVKCTYIEIDQARHTNAVVLSRPSWIWGAEMGVNEFGVCIGNEAIFTKGKYGETSLIGMDFLRLALERSKTAKEALDTITDLLSTYDQGGNCGFDSDFHYDNSYLIMDRTELYVLETVGKNYTYKKNDYNAISNCISIGEDGDFYGTDKCDFKKLYENKLMTKGAQAEKRRSQALAKNVENVKDMIALLSSHEEGASPFEKGTVGSICMHASNKFTCDETTNSMIVELKENGVIIWLTGCSHPCVSLFIPHPFASCGLIKEGPYQEENQFWLDRESLHRNMVGKTIPNDIYEDKKRLQSELIISTHDGITEQVTTKALRTEQGFFNKWNYYVYKPVNVGFVYKKFWEKKNKAFSKNKKEE